MTTFVNLPEDQRLFLDTASNALEEYRPTPLDRTTAKNLAAFCEDLATQFKDRGFRSLYSLAKSARELATAFNYAATSAQRVQCSQTFKEVLFFIHNHLVRVVVQGENSASTVELVRILSKTRKILDSLKTASDTTVAHAPTIEAEPTVQSEPAPSQVSDLQSPKSTSYAIFRVAQRRYAIELSYVISVGTLGIENRLTNAVTTPEGKATLNDLKKQLGIAGETGNVYITVRTQTGLVAWAVDGLEGMRHDTHFEVRPMNIIGRPANARLKNILEGFVKEHPHAQPIFIINPDYLKAIKTLARAH